MRILLVLFLSIILCYSCSSENDAAYSYHQPEPSDDGLKVGSLVEVDISEQPLSNAIKQIELGKYKEVHSILIFKNDCLVFEEYFKGHQFDYEAERHLGKLIQWDQSTIHRAMSVTKSITSACIGIAIDKGFIQSGDQSVFDYLPGYQELNTQGKKEIAIKNLLTMTSGLEGNEWLLPYSNPRNDILMTYYSEDPIAHILGKPLMNKPGTNFQYFGGSNLLLAEILKNATKMNLDEFAEQYLFNPLGISSYQWLKINKGIVDGAGGLIMKPRDLLKIGVTYLNYGIWNRKQIISREWIDKCASPFTGNQWVNNWDDEWGMRGYAYSWWTHSFVRAGEKLDMYYAAGWGGQYIMVIPKLKTVVVFTGGNYTSYRPPFEILKKYIIPAIQ
jgi:CubicO group peptidase (beta-lactamase class C family)